MQLRIVASRHSAFYSPLIACIGAGFLEREGFEPSYGVLEKGQRAQDLIRDGVADVMQSAVSSNWNSIERGESPLPVHFAQINQRDGFFLVANQPDAHFNWKKLEGASLLADHGGQPLAMLKYAVHYNGVDWAKIHVKESGAADYGHFQAPSEGIPVASVGLSMPPVAFSSLCARAGFPESAAGQAFLRAFSQARAWVRGAPPEEVAASELRFFPTVERGQLAEAIRRYQQIGCWDGGIQIPLDLYEQSLNVFEFNGGIQHRHPYQQVCVQGLTA